MLASWSKRLRQGCALQVQQHHTKPAADQSNYDTTTVNDMIFCTTTVRQQATGKRQQGNCM
jgi:hypothetical protein